MQVKFKFMIILLVIPLTIFQVNMVTSTTSNTLPTAINLPLNTTMSGNMPNTRYFNLSMPSTGYYRFNVTPDPSTTLYFDVHDSSGKYITGSSSFGGPDYLLVNLTKGNYYVDIWDYSGPGSFNISVFPYTIHPGEVLSNAINLPINTITNGTMPTATYFNFTIPISGSNDYYNFNLTAPSGSYFLNVYDSLGNYIGGTSNNAYPANVPLNLTAGNYYIRMADVSGTGIFYISFVPYTIHPGEDLAHAFSLTLNTNITGNMPFDSYYNFTIQTAGYYNFYLSADPYKAFYIDIDNKDGSYITGSNINLYPVNLQVNLAKGNYYVKVYDFNSVGPYNLSVTNYNYYTGIDLAHAITLSENTVISGSIPTNIFYNISLSQSGTYSFNLSSSSLVNISLGIFSYDGYLIYNLTSNNSPLEANVTLSSGFYFMNITSDTGTGNYNLSYSLIGTNSGYSPSPNPSSTPPSTTSTTPNTSSSTNQSSGINTSKTSTTTPFSTIGIIMSSLMMLAVGLLIRRRK